MFENARNHFIQNVRPSYLAFFEQRRIGTLGVNDLVRYGTQAAAALFHMREHLPDFAKESRSKFEGICSDYGLLGDVANVAKHSNLTIKSPQISYASQIFEAGVNTQFRDEEGVYWIPQAEIFIRLDDGSERRLAELLHNVMAMWISHLRSLDIVDFGDPSPLELDRHRARDDIPNSGTELAINSGEEWKLENRLRRFDYELGRSIPFDLTGCQMRMTISKPPSQVSIQFGLKDGESPTSFDVLLSEKQSFEFASLRTPIDRQEYLNRLIATSSDLQAAMLSKYAAEHSDLSSASALNGLYQRAELIGVATE